MVTINDIAKMAGVAKSTVSRYLNDGSVSAKTKARLDRIIAETDYVPNRFAQSLKIKKSNIIGTIVPRLDSYASNMILGSIDEELRRRNYQLLITNSNQDIDREIENIYTLSRQKVAGIILLASRITKEHHKAIKAIGIPIIFLGQKTEATYSIIHDELEAGYKMGQHAANLGHRKILYLTVYEDDEAVGKLRKQGVIKSLAEYPDVHIEVVETSFSYEDAYVQALQLLSSTEATYVMCATDNIALAVNKAAVKLGIKVPENLSVSGFGGYEITSLVTPTITTVRYPYKELGRIAVENMVRLLDGESVPKCITLSNEFVEQGSTRKR